MERTYTFRLYPTDDQKALLAKSFGCCRYVYNWALSIKKDAWDKEKRNVSIYDLTKRLSQELKLQNEWLKDVNAQSLQYQLRILETAYSRFFNGKAHFPKFKCKDDVNSFHNPQNIDVDFSRGLLFVPKFRGSNGLRCVFHRRFSGHIVRATIKLERSGKYYVMLLVTDNTTIPDTKMPFVDSSIGIDTGLKSLAVLSDGRVFGAQHFLRKEQHRLKRLQRSLCRKKKGSANRAKIKHRIAVVSERIANRRKDYIDKVTSRIVHDSQVHAVCVEDLNMKLMIKNKHLAYDVQDAGIGLFYRTLEYKCKWHGIHYIKIGRLEPSSQLCHQCGYRNVAVKNLDVRQWVCPVCGETHDRDLNAAINIRDIALKKYLPMERGEVRPVEVPTVDDRSSEPKKQCSNEAGKVSFRRKRSLRPKN